VNGTERTGSGVLHKLRNGRKRTGKGAAVIIHSGIEKTGKRIMPDQEDGESCTMNGIFFYRRDGLEKTEKKYMPEESNCENHQNGCKSARSILPEPHFLFPLRRIFAPTLFTFRRLRNGFKTSLSHCA
jgi:hypothetical protein